jgi:pimeloyl-ACP methyl ester carboxylesterase
MARVRKAFRFRFQPAALSSGAAVTSPVRSSYVDIDGPVHLADYGGNPAGPTVLFVHGLAGSHVSWRGLADGMAQHARVLAVDLPGHGRTPRLGRSAAVLANRKTLDRLVHEVIGVPVTLVGHSMGATLSVLQAAARPDSVEALALIALPMPHTQVQLPSRVLAAQIALCAWPWLGRVALARRLRRLGADEFVRAGLRRTCVCPDDVDPVTRQLAIELVETRAAGDDAEAAFVEAARSMGRLVTGANTYRRVIAAVRSPTVVLHGERDRLVRASHLAQLGRLQPGWAVEVLEGVGHSPHLEALHRTTAVVLNLVRAGARSMPSATALPLPARPVASRARRSVDLAALSPTLTVED